MMGRFDSCLPHLFIGGLTVATISSDKPWGSTPDTVLASTRVEEVTPDQINVAASLIETYTGLAGRSLSRWPDRKLIWLQRATDYQAAYIVLNPDVFTIGIYKSLAADGVRQSFIDADNTLSPVARRCLMKLAKKQKARTLSLRGGSGIIARSKPQVIDLLGDPYDGRIWTEY